ncbi:MAG: helix-turn-helix domain-containing protein [Ktedonobacteraceae bacterium]
MRAYKYRFYPTEEQEQVLARTFGCARFVYNWALRLHTDAYYKEHKRLYHSDTSAMLTQLKQQEDYAWLNEVSCVPTQQALRHLDKAFRNFFEERATYPTFKKRGSKNLDKVGHPLYTCPMKNKRLLSPKEAAFELGISIKTVHRWDEAGKLYTVRTAGNQRRIPIEEISRLRKQGEGKPGAERCVLYARIASVRQEQDGNLARQSERLKEAARARGYEVVALRSRASLQPQ